MRDPCSSSMTKQVAGRPSPQQQAAILLLSTTSPSSVLICSKQPRSFAPLNQDLQDQQCLPGQHAGQQIYMTYMSLTGRSGSHLDRGQGGVLPQLILIGFHDCLTCLSQEATAGLLLQLGHQLLNGFPQDRLAQAVPLFGHRRHTTALVKFQHGLHKQVLQVGNLHAKRIETLTLSPKGSKFDLYAGGSTTSSNSSSCPSSCCLSGVRGSR